MKAMKIEELKTPAFLVSLPKLIANIQNMQAQAPIAFNKFPLGSLLQIIPNHSCLTAALFLKYQVIEGNRVVDEWRPMRGW